MEVQIVLMYGGESRAARVDGKPGFRSQHWLVVVFIVVGCRLGLLGQFRLGGRCSFHR